MWNKFKACYEVLDEGTKQDIRDALDVNPGYDFMFDMRKTASWMSDHDDKAFLKKAKEDIERRF